MKTYGETLQFLFSQLPMYQRIGKAAYKADLSNIERLDKYFSHPHRSFKSIHVGGTNGKGSVSNIIASIFQESGYKTGLYTSPHLKDYRERIRINGKMIDKAFVTQFVHQHQPIIKEIRPSFFEITQMMAFEYFKAQKIDVAIIEVGMGGRLDSTNIIQPELSIITNVSFDHTQFLGNSLSRIAYEKAGIIKPQTPVVIGRKQPETLPVFIQTASRKNAPLIFAEDNSFNIPSCPLQGAYQKENIKTAITAIYQLKDKFNIPEQAIISGIKNVVVNTGFRGRWEKLSDSPRIVADTAHNEEGIRQVIQQIEQQSFKELHIVLGMVNDKNVDQLLALFPKKAHYYFCHPDIPRKMPVEQLAYHAQKHHLKGTVFHSVQEALKSAKSNATEEDMIFIGGSTFVVAEIL